MKKVLILICSVLFFATSCLNSGNTTNSSEATFYGKVVVSDVTTGEVSYSENKAEITVQIPNAFEPKLDIVFNKIKFDERMPVQLNIKMSGVPFVTTVSEDQTTINYIFKAENVVPTIGGIKYESFKASVIEGCIGREVDVTFVIPSKEKRVHFTNALEKVEPAVEE